MGPESVLFSVAFPWLTTLFCLTKYANTAAVHCWTYAGIVLIAVFSSWRDTDVWSNLAILAVGMVCVLVLFVTYSGADPHRVVSNILPGLVCLSVIPVWILTAHTPDPNSRSAPTAAWHICTEAWDKGIRALVVNTKLIGLLLLISPCMFWCKYNNTRRKLVHAKSQGLKPKELNVQDELLKSECVASVMVVVICIFIFFQLLDVVGISSDSVAQLSTYFALSVGWALKDLLGGVFTGFSLVFNSDMSPGQLLQLEDGQQFVVVEVGITHTKCRVHGQVVYPSDSAYTRCSQTDSATCDTLRYDNGTVYIPNGRFALYTFTTYDKMVW